MLRHTAALLGLACLASSPVLAEDRANRFIGLMLDRVDTDGDGELSRPEIAAARERQFARVDADADGKLTTAELAAAQDRLSRFVQMAQLSLTERASRLDTDGDSVISREEFVRPSPIFTLIDADGNAALSRAEIDRARAAFSPQP